MKRIVFFHFILLCFNTALFAQKVGDTIYYDSRWKEIKGKENASYFRSIDKKAKGITYVTDHYINGRPQMTGAYSSFDPEVKDGEFVFYNADGKMSSAKMYKGGKQNGKSTEFYPNGQVHFEGIYVKDLMEGTFTSYYPSGKIKRVEEYSKGEVVGGKRFTSTGADTVFTPYMMSPMFKGGEDSLSHYIVKHLTYPEEARKGNINGKVFITFIVSKTGELAEAYVSKSVDPLLDQAALAIVKSMPTWNPGRVDDVPQRFQFSIPINFSLK